MSEEEAVVAIAFFVAATVSIIVISLAVLRHQGNKLKYSNPEPNRDLDARMARMEQALDSIAVEVERISEGQRFTTKLLSDRAALDGGRISVGGREG